MSGIHLLLTALVVVVLIHNNDAFQLRHHQHVRLQTSLLYASVEPSDISGQMYDLAIIGAGPVGVSAALLAASKNNKGCTSRRIVLIDAPRGMS